MKKLLILLSIAMGNIIGVDYPENAINDMFKYTFGKKGKDMSKLTQDLLKRCANGNNYDKKACKAGKQFFAITVAACRKKALKDKNPFDSLWYLGYSRPGYMEELKSDLIRRP